VSVCNLRPDSRGTCHITAKDSNVAPAIKPNYLSCESDKLVAVESIRHARKLMTTNYMSKYQPEEIKPGPEMDSNGELEKAAGDIATTIFHPVGTAKMGHDDMSVVDKKLKIHGLNGIRVVDGAIMPRIVSGNTHARITMIAEKAADMIIQENK